MKLKHAVTLSILPASPALCPPSHLEGRVDCGTNILSLTWDQSPVFGANYTLHSQQIGGANTSALYSPTDTSHYITGLGCGERYAFRVAASDDTCNSSLSPPLEVDTGTTGPLPWQPKTGAVAVATPHPTPPVSIEIGSSGMSKRLTETRTDNRFEFIVQPFNL